MSRAAASLKAVTPNGDISHDCVAKSGLRTRLLHEPVCHYSFPFQTRAVLTLPVFEELNLPEAFLCLLDSLMRSSEILALARNDLVATFHFLERLVGL